jgi:hypothetical protein
MWGGEQTSIQSSTIYAETSKLYNRCKKKGKKNNDKNSREERSIETEEKQNN